MAISEFLLAAGSGWLVAQVAKYLVGGFKTGQWSDASRILRSGSMPSVHTATIVSLTVMIGVREGVNSAVFALSLLLAAIVAYDAMGVRRATGEQGLALTKLLKLKRQTQPYLSLGHKPQEVLVGVIVGVGVGLVVAFFTSNM